LISFKYFWLHAVFVSFLSRRSDGKRW
jgi:hypothetical protein